MKFAIFVTPSCWHRAVTGDDTVIFYIRDVEGEDPVSAVKSQLDPNDEYNIYVLDADEFLAKKFGVDKIIYSDGKRR